MKKTLIALSTLLLLVSCTSTKGSKDLTKVSVRDFHKVAENLYEITVDDYNFEYAQLTESEALNLQKFSCSSVRNGNYYGRSFDFIYDDSFELVVHTTKAPGRYASVAMTGTQNIANIELIENQSDKDVLSKVALVLTDGINEKGVVCNINVVPVEDLETTTTGTNPGKPDLNMSCLIRFILDNASSAKEAIRLLKNRNICMPRDFYQISKMGYELHLMVADAKNTYVVEFVNNEMKVLKGQKIMTNYYLSLDEVTAHGSGVERYQILSDNYDMATSVEGTAKLMEKVKFTNSYTKPIYDDMVAKTEAYDFNNFNIPEWKDDMDAYASVFMDDLKNIMDQKSNPTGVWITMHMTVFDIENKTMRVIVQERYDEPHFFNI